MKNLNKKITIFLTLLASISIAGCSNTNTGGGSKEPTYDINDFSKIETLQKAMYYIAKEKNYTMKYSGKFLVDHEFLFTKYSIGVISDVYPEMDKIYYRNDTKGIYKIGFNGEEFVSSEYLNGSKEIWDNKIVYSMYGVNESYILNISPKATNLTINDKEYKIAFLKTVGYQAYNYLELNSLNVSFDNSVEGSPKLVYEMMYRNTLFTYTVTNFGTTKNQIVSNFLKNKGHVYAPDPILAKMRVYLRGNNFTHHIYHLGSTKKECFYIGYEYFHQHYFYSYTKGTYYIIGAIALKNKFYGLDGCYSCAVSYNEEWKPTGVQLIGTPVYQKADIVEYYHYPTYLSLLNSLEYAHKWNDKYITASEYTPKGVSYMVTNTTLLSDFAYNFSLSDSSSSFYGHTPVALGIDYMEKNSEGLETIMFTYKFYLKGYYYVLPIPLQNFGQVSNEILDLIYDAYNQ